MGLMSAPPQPAHWYRLLGPRVFRWAICGTDPLEIISKGRLRGTGTAPSREGFPEGGAGFPGKGDDASHWVTISLDKERIPPGVNLSEDVVERPDQLSGGYSMFHALDHTEVC